MILLLQSPELAGYAARLEEILQENAQRLHISNINVSINNAPINAPCICASLQAENTNIQFKMQYDDNTKRFVDTKFTINGKTWNIVDKYQEHGVKNESFDTNQQQLVDLIEKIQNKTIDHHAAHIVLQSADARTSFYTPHP